MSDVPTITCRGCGRDIVVDERLADGCPCNSPCGVNHGLVPQHVCTCNECDPKQTGSVRFSPMTFREFAVLNRQRCESANGFNHLLGSWSLSDWMTATMGELGEAANIAKKLNRVRDGIPGNKESEIELRFALQEEIADVFIYLDLLAQAAGFSLEAAVRTKFNKTSEKIGCKIEA